MSAAISHTPRQPLSSFRARPQLKEILSKANKLHENVTKPREHAKDTELLCTLAASGLTHAKKSLLAGKRLNTAKDLVNALKCEYLAGWTPDASSAGQVSEPSSPSPLSKYDFAA